MLTSLPDPAPGTVRRTLSLEVSPDGDWSAGLRVTASGRDLHVRACSTAGTSDGAAVPGGSVVLRAARMSVTIDTASRVTGIESELPAAVTDPLIGATAVRGFRARLAGLGELDPSSLESAVLDELPTIRLISGYARMIELIALTGADGVAEVTAAAEAAGGPGMAALRRTTTGARRWWASARAGRQARRRTPGYGPGFRS